MEGQSGSPAGSGGQAAIKTGDATTTVDVTNAINTNITNSKYAYNAHNIYIDEKGNIDLSKSDFSGVNLSSLTVNSQNQATVVNLIYAGANSGQNIIYGTGGITTGNAYVSVNVLNFINTNLVGSSWQIVFINIFGSLTGNVLLPEPSSAKASAGAKAVADRSEGQAFGQTGEVNSKNDANIQNSVDISANTGGNNVAGGGNIKTGNAQAIANVQTLANTNILSGNWYRLVINNFGVWNGQFLGWGVSGPQDPAFGQMIFDYAGFSLQGLASKGGSKGGSEGGCGCVTTVGSTNTAVLANAVLAGANTGTNNISGEGNITTGNAYSAVNIFSFINSNIIRSSGFFGVINIFGTLNGDVGGASLFVPKEENVPSKSQTKGEEVRGEGGALATSMSTNVGTHVNPGDTVTFFINAANTGTGPVYDSKVVFNMYDANGNLAAVQTFDLGRLDVGRKAKISFGLVLANTAPSGIYKAVVQAEGKVGPKNDVISSQSKTNFMVGLGGGILGSSIVGEVQAAATGGTTGVTGTGGSGADGTRAVSSIWKLIFMFLGTLGLLYIAYRLFARPVRLAAVYLRKKDIRGLKLMLGGYLRPVSKLASKISSKALALKTWLF